MNSFSLLRQPRVFFGPGTIKSFPSLIHEFGRNVLLVTGTATLQRSESLASFHDRMQAESLCCHHYAIKGEPSPELVDRAVEEYGCAGIQVVVAVGGGSALDAGKAISAMLVKKEPVGHFIEGQPEYREHDGSKVPFIAVPTTSGTGSEATNNAVISKVADSGYKRSLRHHAFVPEVAVIDPILMLSLPFGLTAASGMDALTQLLEALVSPYGSPYTDAVALSGIELFSQTFIRACHNGAADIDARSGMAYAALMSGIALANAGLGIVHGFASSAGGYVAVPHGQLCATLLYPATRENISQLRGNVDRSAYFLAKYAKAGRLLSEDSSLNDDEGCCALLEKLESWQRELQFPRLGDFGIVEKDVDFIVSKTRSKSNPVELSVESMKKILKERL